MIIAFFLIVGYLITAISNNVAEIERSRAIIESARAAQDAAQAAQIASAGLAGVSLIQSLILGGIIFTALLLIIIAAYLILDRRAHNNPLVNIRQRRWASGSNARFRKADDTAQLAPGDAVKQLAQLMLIQQMAQMQNPQLPQPSQTTTTIIGDEEDNNLLW